MKTYVLSALKSSHGRGGEKAVVCDSFVHSFNQKHSLSAPGLAGIKKTESLCSGTSQSRRADRAQPQ